MAEHTKEPWAFDGQEMTGPDRSRLRLVGVATPLVYGALQDEARATSRRIVACVNACAGIPIEALERAANAMGDYSRAKFLADAAGDLAKAHEG